MKRRQFLSAVNVSSTVVAAAFIGGVQPCPVCHSLWHSASHHSSIPTTQESQHHEA